jgi:hypothetical protein
MQPLRCLSKGFTCFLSGKCRAQVIPKLLQLGGLGVVRGGASPPPETLPACGSSARWVGPSNRQVDQPRNHISRQRPQTIPPSLELTFLPYPGDEQGSTTVESHD